MEDKSIGFEVDTALLRRGECPFNRELRNKKPNVYKRHSALS